MDEIVCSRCFGSHPYVAVVHCLSSVVPGGLYLCESCHRRLHPGCCSQMATRSEMKDYCFWCRSEGATLLCPLCVVNEENWRYVKLCESCNNELHVDHKEIHKDHLIPIS